MSVLVHKHEAIVRGDSVKIEKISPTFVWIWFWSTVEITHCTSVHMYQGPSCL